MLPSDGLFETIHEDIVQLGKDRDKLSEKNFEELSDIIISQMSGGDHFSNNPLLSQINGYKELIDDEDTYDTFNLMCLMEESFGKILAKPFNLETTKKLEQKLCVLYESAINCEEEIKRKYPASDLLFVPRPHSMEIKGCQLILEGYQKKDNISVEEEAKKLYGFVLEEDVKNIPEFIDTADRYVIGIGQIIRQNDNDLKILIKVFGHISYQLNDRIVDCWTDELDEDSQEYKLLDSQTKKFWACYQVINWYSKEKFGAYRIELSEKDDDKKREIIKGIKMLGP